MRCPFGCTNWMTKVVDSRPDYDTGQVKRRRICTECDKAFFTIEAVNGEAKSKDKLIQARAILAEAAHKMNKLIGGWHTTVGEYTSSQDP